jgi:hypothetical protein
MTTPEPSDAEMEEMLLGIWAINRLKPRRLWIDGELFEADANGNPLHQATQSTPQE